MGGGGGQVTTPASSAVRRARGQASSGPGAAPAARTAAARSPWARAVTFPAHIPHGHLLVPTFRSVPLDSLGIDHRSCSVALDAI
jgi:hypothetical protein